jgi:iron complex transport system ATP-binding protein
LRTLCGVLPPLAGTVQLDGGDLHKLTARRRAQAVTMTLTDRVAVPHLTVRDLVAWSRHPYLGLSAQQTDKDAALIDQSLSQVGMTDLAARPLQRLSDGERTRAQIAAALCQDTPYILLDEPTAHLDVRNRRTVMLLLCRLAHDLRKGILLSTHELTLACSTADRLWVLAPQGQVHKDTPAALQSSGVLETIFNTNEL